MRSKNDVASLSEKFSAAPHLLPGFIFAKTQGHFYLYRRGDFSLQIAFSVDHTQTKMVVGEGG